MKSARSVTQIDHARDGTITHQMTRVAHREGLSVEMIREAVACGRVVIPANIHHGHLDPMAIGSGMRVKVNANIGNSQVTSSIQGEVEKLRTAMQFGADTVMDLSDGKDIAQTRSAILADCSVPLGTVPIYEAFAAHAKIAHLTTDDLISVIEKQAQEGVDYMTLHCGILREHLALAKNRLTGIVSRGGGILAAWMKEKGQQNPLYVHYDKVLDILQHHDVTISLGDALRPGCLHDASDETQFAELKVLGELTKRAWEKGVQVMVEGPGHLPLHHIEFNVRRQKEICHGAPFYVLGPLVVDCAAGYDHIASAIGAAIAGWHGADMLCYVTPKEHLGLPNVDDVKQGVIAYKIAAHAADVARGRTGARDRDDRISRARVDFDWNTQFELSFDPETAKRHHDEALPDAYFKTAPFCSMCGPQFCPMHIAKN